MANHSLKDEIQRGKEADLPDTINAIFDGLIAAVSLGAAFFWLKAARVRYSDGAPPMILNPATPKGAWRIAGRSNAYGAGFAALAAVLSALKTTLTMIPGSTQ